MKKIRRTILFFMFLLLPITLNYFSPYLIIDGLINKTLGAAFFIWSAIFLSSFVIGRSFCAYVCPYGGLQMIVDGAINKPLKEIAMLRIIKKVLGGIWLIIILLLIFFNLISSRIDFLYLTETFVSVDNIIKLIGYYVIVLGLLILPLALGKRATCHYLCPMSILNMIGTKAKNILNLPSLRLVAIRKNCTGCKQCNKVCPMSLNVSAMVKIDDMNNSECILCGECSNACKFKAVQRTFGRDPK